MPSLEYRNRCRRPLCSTLFCERVPVDCPEAMVMDFTAGEGERVRSSAVTAPRVAVMVAVPSSVTVGSERVSVVVSVSSLMVTTALSVVTRDSKPPPDAA